MPHNPIELHTNDVLDALDIDAICDDVFLYTDFEHTPGQLDRFEQLAFTKIYDMLETAAEKFPDVAINDTLSTGNHAAEQYFLANPGNIIVLTSFALNQTDLRDLIISPCIKYTAHARALMRAVTRTLCTANNPVERATIFPVSVANALSIEALCSEYHAFRTKQVLNTAALINPDNTLIPMLLSKAYEAYAWYKGVESAQRGSNLAREYYAGLI
ncbi:hypothetical protein N24_1928 [Corynebacterium suranareeae]|uniref:Uncharacterized protein n=1 Tax=Corynebacterium suranareeae TaxID=2506452 RepID=A0A160PUD4_9CORY|nr:hypothetical protein [Corynebacterium suranareeae]BAU96190.1 hypothetical protein N24_1928 [Corynebacterium suranareeae]